MHPEAGPVRAPEIGLPDLEWFNTPTPLSLAALRGRLAILDFWTYCCINCMHVLPALKRVEEAFPDTVVVVGVHSPKFAAERSPQNLAAAIARYGIAHPVVNDPAFRIWKSYAVRAWPTLVFVGPDGYVLGQHSGEPNAERLLDTVRAILDEYARNGLVIPRRQPTKSVDPHRGRFRFPGKIKSTPEGDWVLADAGHHQIVILDRDGHERDRFGDGTAGMVDGPAGDARFDGPQGLIVGSEAIYVADTGNHAIRRIDRASGAVATLAGTGRRGPVLGEWTDASAAALASPWDLELDGDRLFFASAGTHQLGELDLAAGRLRRVAGSGAEALRDGPAETACLAQPSALALDPRRSRLFFVDSETSSIRALGLDAESRVETLVGAGLFEFGLVGGDWSTARFQHPLGLAWHDAADGPRVVVADSYNGRIRALDLARRIVVDLDERLECADSVCLPAGEPAGVAADGPQRLLVVDTNNHRILAYDLAAAKYRTWAE